jgi:hypothetical protein
MYHHLGDFDYSCFCDENLGKSLFNRSIIAKDAKKDLKGRHYSYLQITLTNIENIGLLNVKLYLHSWRVCP